MAHRQLSSLVRRIRTPLVDASVHRRALQQLLNADHLDSEHVCFSTLGSRFFSKSSSHRRAAGKTTNVAQNVVSSQAQGSASQTHEDQSKRSASQALEDQSKSSGSQALEEQSRSIGSSEQSSSNYALIVGTCAALVIGLFAFFPWDLLKGYYTGEKKELGLPSESEEKSSKGAVLPSKPRHESEQEKPPLEGSKDSTLAQDQENTSDALVPEKGIDSQETAHVQYSELMKENSTGSGDPNAAKSIALKNAVDNQISALKSEDQMLTEADSEDVNSHSTIPMNDHLSKEDLSTRSLLDNVKDKLNLATTESRDDTVVPISQTTSDYVSSKESVTMQTPSRSPIRRPNMLEAYYLGEVSNPALQDNIQVIKDKGYLSNRDQLKNSQGGDPINKLHIDGVQNVLDLLDVVHAAEKRQAELDAELYKEAQKRLKRAFQQELKDAHARELMYAEEVSRLAKELNLEKERAAATLESEQKMARIKLFEELKHKEEEANVKLKKAEFLSKTEVAVAVAKEKLSYINDVRTVRQELEALYIVLFTQSKDFRQSHTIHKLAMGTFALENAMKMGAPLEEEVTLICSAYKDAGTDPVLEAIISSFPEHVLKNGTLTPYQLHEKFDSLKKGVLELSLIPATGGGLISHAAAKVVSTLKVKESGQFSAGVAAVVSQVQKCLADGKLIEAAQLLEKGVNGTKAEFLVADWIEKVRERAMVEQMLLLLQAHTTAAASTLA